MNTAEIHSYEGQSGSCKKKVFLSTAIVLSGKSKYSFKCKGKLKSAVTH